MEPKKENSFNKQKFICDWCKEKEYKISIYDDDEKGEILLCGDCYEDFRIIETYED